MAWEYQSEPKFSVCKWCTLCDFFSANRSQLPQGMQKTWRYQSRFGINLPCDRDPFHVWFNTLRWRQNGRHFADDIFRCIFLNDNVWISIKISLKFVPKGQIKNITALVQIMAWRRPGDKPISEPMLFIYWCIYASLGLNDVRAFLSKFWKTPYALDLKVMLWSCHSLTHGSQKKHQRKACLYKERMNFTQRWVHSANNSKY